MLRSPATMVSISMTMVSVSSRPVRYAVRESYDKPALSRRLKFQKFDSPECFSPTSMNLQTVDVELLTCQWCHDRGTHDMSYDHRRICRCTVTCRGVVAG